MKAICVLYEGRHGNEMVPDTFFAAGNFPKSEKTVFFGIEGKEYPQLPPDIQVVYKSSWTEKNLMEELSRVSLGYDFIYYAWADCPFLDPELAASLAERHIRYGAEYSYADGWPYGFAPELLAHETAGILAKFGDEAKPVERSTLFDLIQKDINAFDIETEISPVDLRPYRLSFTADSKRNKLLISRFRETVKPSRPGGFISVSGAEQFINEKPMLLRTLPAFFNIQVSGGCPQACSFCPWPVYGGTDITARKDFMTKEKFALLLDKIVDFAGDGVIDLSLWGELSLHPEKMELIQMVLSRPALSLVIETSGIGWKIDELEALARYASGAVPGRNQAACGFTAPLSWIVSLDAFDPGRYKEIRGPGYSEARSCAKTLFSLFPRDTYVQAVRVKGFEDDIEHFYRSWKGEDLPPEVSAAGRNDGSHIIIQKYDDFAGALPKMQASDLSPVRRRPCWHIQRDMNILLDGTVPCCREDLAALKGKGDKPAWGNAFSEDLSLIWERGADIYKEHCQCEYKGICGNCDEYYTYNF